MSASRFLLLAVSVVLSSFAVVPGVSNANEEFYADRSCLGCHTPAPVTCNGCHGHGTHDTLAKSAMNLAATTDKSSYVVGDDISVTLTGGYKPTGWKAGWVRVNVYDSSGTPLVSNSTECPHNATSYAATCDFPVTLKTRAVAGMTSLYVAWMGHENDKSSPVTGSPIASGIGVGKRAASLAQHVEEVVLTNTFTVTDSAPTPTPTPAPAPASSGGGSFDWLLLSGLMGMFFLRRKTAR